jgi:hypothetical protein
MEDERGKSCDTHGTKKVIYSKFLLENLKGRHHLEDPSIGGKTIINWILAK